jgi:hypothetical protein
MKKYTVYVASPYTKPEGKQLENTLNSFKVFNDLVKLDFIPFAPLTSHFIHECYPQDYKFWIDYDLEWLKYCDFLLRFPGESIGADNEVLFAEKNGIPVFYNIDDLVNFANKRKNIII